MSDSPESRTPASSIFQALQKIGSPELSGPNSFANFFQKGIERMADFEKIALDFYARQTFFLIDSWKRFAVPASIPGAYFMDIAGQGVHRYIEMRKEVLNLIVQQSAKGIDVFRPSKPGISAEEKNRDAIDVLIPEQEEDALIAAKVVDRIAEMVSRKETPLVPDAAVQQMTASSGAAGEAKMTQSGARRQPNNKKQNAAKQKNNW